MFDGDFDVTVTCGVMTVPVDRAQPDKTTTLEVAVFEGDDAADGVPTVYLGITKQ